MIGGFMAEREQLPRWLLVLEYEDDVGSSTLAVRYEAASIADAWAKAEPEYLDSLQSIARIARATMIRVEEYQEADLVARRRELVEAQRCAEETAVLLCAGDAGKARPFRSRLRGCS